MFNLKSAASFLVCFVFIGQALAQVNGPHHANPSGALPVCTLKILSEQAKSNVHKLAKTTIINERLIARNYVDTTASYPDSITYYYSGTNGSTLDNQNMEEYEEPYFYPFTIGTEGRRKNFICDSSTTNAPGVPVYLNYYCTYTTGHKLMSLHNIEYNADGSYDGHFFGDSLIYDANENVIAAMQTVAQNTSSPYKVNMIQYSGFDNNGHLLYDSTVKSDYWVTLPFQNYTRVNYTYNPAGYRTSYRVSAWDTTLHIWKDSVKDAYTYDGFNRLIRTDNYIWNDTGWKARNYDSLVYTNTTDAEPEMSFSRSYQSTTGSIEYRNFYYYNNGQTHLDSARFQYDHVGDAAWTDDVQYYFEYNTFDHCTRWVETGMSNWDIRFYYELYNAPTSIASTTSLAVRIFPNPTNDKVWFQTSDNLSATVCDMSGHILLHRGNVDNIDLKGFPSGLYLLQLSNNKTGETGTYRLVKK